jgi:hypothetical protein
MRKSKSLWWTAFALTQCILVSVADQGRIEQITQNIALREKNESEV